MLSPQRAKAINRRYVMNAVETRRLANIAIINDGLVSKKEEILKSINSSIRGQCDCTTVVKKWNISVVIRLKWSGLYDYYDAEDSMIRKQIMEILSGWISECGWIISDQNVHFRSTNYPCSGIPVVLGWYPGKGNKSIDRKYEFECVLTLPEDLTDPETPDGL